MAAGTKTNERPGTRAQVKYARVSAYKAREVLDLIRGKHVAEADDILAFVERDVAITVRKCLASAVANATTNDNLDAETLHVSACYADEGPTLKRWRPRARGRATRIRKRTCHITVIVGRLPDNELRVWQARQDKAAPSGASTRRRGGAPADRRARVAKSRQVDGVTSDTDEGIPGEPDEAAIDAAEQAADGAEATTTDAAEATTEVAGEPTEETIEAAEEAAESAEEADALVKGAPNASDAAEAPAGTGATRERDGEASTEEPATKETM